MIADEVGVTGWVRNRRDGTVEAEVEGTPDQVDEMLAWMAEGPPGSRVESADGDGCRSRRRPAGSRSAHRRR